MTPTIPLISGLEDTFKLICENMFLHDGDKKTNQALKSNQTINLISFQNEFWSWVTSQNFHCVTWMEPYNDADMIFRRLF